MFEESPYAPILKLTWAKTAARPRALMQSSAPATAFAPPAPDAAWRLLTELRRHCVAFTRFEAPQPFGGGAA